MKGKKKYTWNTVSKYQIEKETHSLRLDKVCVAAEDCSQTKTFTIGWFSNYDQVAQELLQLGQLSVTDVKEIKSANKKAIENLKNQLVEQTYARD